MESMGGKCSEQGLRERKTARWVIVQAGRKCLASWTRKLDDFLNHVNSIHTEIQFNLEIESDGHLPFVCINIYRKWMVPWVTLYTGS
jgi:hypothetical protein